MHEIFMFVAERTLGKKDDLASSVPHNLMSVG